jgi:hypothetical protein
VASFALAKQGSRFFQQEARVANAQFSATLGFDRLRADIARAGFLSTGNVQRDPSVCPNVNPTAGWPAGMVGLAAMRITAATPVDGQDSANGLSPDQLTLAGSYASPGITVARNNAHQREVQVVLNQRWAPWSLGRHR